MRTTSTSVNWDRMSARIASDCGSAFAQSRNTWISDAVALSAAACTTRSLATGDAASTGRGCRCPAVSDQPARSPDQDPEAVEHLARGQPRAPPDDLRGSQQAPADVLARAPQHVAVARGEVLGVEASLAAAVSPAYEREFAPGSPSAVV